MQTSTFGVRCSGRRVARDLVTCFSRHSLVRRRITGSRVTLCITRGLIGAILCRPVRLPCNWRTNRASSRLSDRCVFRAHHERPRHAEARSTDRSPNWTSSPRNRFGREGASWSPGVASGSRVDLQTRQTRSRNDLPGRAQRRAGSPQRY